MGGLAKGKGVNPYLDPCECEDTKLSVKSSGAHIWPKETEENQQERVNPFSGYPAGCCASVSTVCCCAVSVGGL